MATFVTLLVQEAFTGWERDLKALQQGLGSVIDIRTLTGGIGPRIRVQALSVIQEGIQRLERRIVPAGMDHTQALGIEVERQRLEPGDYLIMQGAVLANLFKEGRVLVAVLFGVGSKALAGLLRVRRLKRNRVELVIAHDGKRGTAVDHRAHQAIRPDLLRAAVDEVANKDGLAIWMPPTVTVPLVAHALEQLFKATSMSMNVADDVVHDLLPGRPSEFTVLTIALDRYP